MDLLVEADTEGKVQEAVFFACADLLNLEVDLLFFDTTSTYFERDEPDAAGEHGEPAFRAYGHSKDHRPDLPQVVIGLAGGGTRGRSSAGRRAGRVRRGTARARPLARRA